MSGRAVGVLRAVALTATLLAATLAAAHEFALEALINAFFKVEQKEAHLVVRAPLYLFKAVRFPIQGIEVDIANSADAMQRALLALQREVVVAENGQPLRPLRASGRLSLPSDRAFQTYETATAHVEAAVEPDTRIVVDQGYVDAHLVYAIDSPDGVFSLRTSAGAEIGSRLSIRFTAADGTSRAVLVRSGAGPVELNPTVWSAASGFVGLGIRHIVSGIDHLLFLLCLIVPLRGVRQLLTIVTGFTIAHSFTLIGSAFGLAPQGPWFAPLVETAIAASIVYMAIENIIGVSISRRVLLAMLFGLVHGFAFAQGLQEELQFAGSHLVTALFAFNLGIELGQLLALAVMLPLLALIVRRILPGRIGAIVLAALIANVGWDWMIDRWEALTKVRWPAFELADLTPMLLWTLGVVALAMGLRALLPRLRLEPVAPSHQQG